MAIGLGNLRLSPRDFWALTIAELEAAIRGLTGLDAAAAAPDRTDLAALMSRYPDCADVRSYG